MFVLTRRPREYIDCILPDGSKVTFMICGVVGNSIRVGIEAGKSVHIVRRELVVKERARG